MPSSFDIQVVKGGGIYEHEFVASGDNQTLDLNGYSLNGYVKFRHGSKKVLLDLEPTPIPGGEDEGSFNISLDAAEMSIPFGSFVYYIDAHSGDASYNLYRGKFEVLTQEQSETPGGFFPPGAATTNWVNTHFYPNTNPNNYISQSQNGVFECNYSGVVDGLNKIFYAPESYVSNTSQVFLNGIRQSRQYSDYVESGNVAFIFDEAPLTDDRLVIDYVAV